MHNLTYPNRCKPRPMCMIHSDLMSRVGEGYVDSGQWLEMMSFSLTHTKIKKMFIYKSKYPGILRVFRF